MTMRIDCLRNPKHLAMMFQTLWIGLALLSISEHASAQLSTGWKQHDMKRPLPPTVQPGESQPGESQLPTPPPSDAVVLFDGKSLDAWRNSDGGPAKWIVRDGAMEPVNGGGYAYSAQGFEDCQLHIEWASPEVPKGKSQNRGNSGVFLQSLFEVQILDSFDNVTYADGQAASIYGQYPPMANVSRKPGQWQAFDILFRAPKYNDDGSLSSPARLTVMHNGVFVQDNVKALGPTSWLQHHPYTKRSDAKRPGKLPIGLQDHGNPVRFRNIWVRELPPETIEPPKEAYDPVIVELTDSQIEGLLGKFQREGGGTYEVLRKEGKLFFTLGGPLLEMIPHSPTEFGLRYTAGLLEFQRNPAGQAQSLRFEMGGSLSKGQRETP
jgi:hypothetical protein